jgi:hypothetical protein
MTDFPLTPHAIARPERVRYFFAENYTDVLSEIKSKSSRKFLRKSDEVLVQNNITWEYKPVSEQEFLDWLPYYREKMTEHGYDILANPEWYQKTVADGKKVEGFFFYKAGKMIGSTILSRIGTENAAGNFKASDRLDLSSEDNSSIGIVIDYFYLREMANQKVKHISAGRSRNAFGVINGIGYLQYKLRLGYSPKPDDGTAMLSTVPLNDQGYVFFYGIKNDQLGAYLVVPKQKPELIQEVEKILGDYPKEIIQYE